MTDIIKIPARSQAYLTAHRDEAVDVFDVVEFTWPYGNAGLVVAYIMFMRVDSGNVQHVYEGALYDDGSTIYTQRNTYSGAAFCNNPVRIMAHGTDRALVAYVEDDGGYMDTYDAGSTYLTEIFDISSYTESLYWEEFDMNADGLAVVAYYRSEDPIYGMSKRVSTDYGVSWSSPSFFTEIKARIESDPFIEYSWYDHWNSWFSMTADRVVGAFYYAMTYQLNSETWENIWGIWKSTNGTSWSLLAEWNFDDYDFDDSLVAIAASNNHVYIGFNKWQDVAGDEQTYYIMASSNGGSSWTQQSLADSGFYNYSGVLRLAANEDVVIAYGSRRFLRTGGYETWKGALFRSTNNGASWTEVVTFNAPSDVTPTIFYNWAHLRSSGSAFVFTVDSAHYPTAAAYSWDDGTVHDMQGSGTRHLVYWISTDNGITWAMKETDSVYEGSDANSIDVYVP